MLNKAIVGFLLAFIWVASAQAQTLYKCVAEGKPASFQNEPCSTGQREVKALNYTPDPVGAYRPDVSTRPYAVSDGRNKSGRVTRMRRVQPSACELARQHRDTVLGRNNQGGNYKVRVALNDAVHDACR